MAETIFMLDQSFMPGYSLKHAGNPRKRMPSFFPVNINRPRLPFWFFVMFHGRRGGFPSAMSRPENILTFCRMLECFFRGMRRPPVK
jgi:hypothetical protein